MPVCPSFQTVCKSMNIQKNVKHSFLRQLIMKITHSLQNPLNYISFENILYNYLYVFFLNYSLLLFLLLDSYFFLFQMEQTSCIFIVSAFLDEIERIFEVSTDFLKQLYSPTGLQGQLRGGLLGGLLQTKKIGGCNLF